MAIIALDLHAIRRSEARFLMGCRDFVRSQLPVDWDLYVRLHVANQTAKACLKAQRDIREYQTPKQNEIFNKKWKASINSDGAKIVRAYEAFEKAVNSARGHFRETFLDCLEKQDVSEEAVDAVFKAMDAAVNRYRKPLMTPATKNRPLSDAGYFDLVVSEVLQASGLKRAQVANILAGLRIQFSIETNERNRDKLARSIEQRLRNKEIK